MSLPRDALIDYILSVSKKAATPRRSIFLPRLGTYTCDRAHANTREGIPRRGPHALGHSPLASHVTLTPPIRILYLSVPARESWYKIQYVRMHLPILFFYCPYRRRMQLGNKLLCLFVLYSLAVQIKRARLSHSLSLPLSALALPFQEKNQGLLISSFAATHPKLRLIKLRTCI